MKIQPNLFRHRSTRGATTIALQLAAVSLITACGAGTTGDTSETDAASTTTAGPSVSAAGLANDNTTSLTYAQSVAAGIIAAPGTANNETPIISAANPLAVVPVSDTDVTAEADESLTTIDALTDSTDAVVSTDSSLIEVEQSVDSVSVDSSSSTDNTITTDTTDTSGTTDTTDTTDTADAVDTSDFATDTTTQVSTDSSTEGDQTVDTTDTTTETTQSPVGLNNNENAVSATEFRSITSPGFNGLVLDDAIQIEWAADPDARGYNVYRQAEYYTTVIGTTEFVDEDVYDRDYYYEIQAFHNDDDSLYYVATGLTVSPTTLGRTDPDELVPDPNLLDDYELVFADEFNGSVLDSTKWNTSYLWGDQLVINSEEQFYVDINNKPDFGFNPFTFDGESLTINSIETPDELLSESLNQPYLSGVITSYDAFKFTYGYAETRAKMTHGRGYWPAFWLLNAYYVDDKPEIDIMEFIGHNQDAVYATYHYFDSDGELRSTKSQATPGVDYTNGWHTYAVDWKPGTLVFYIDGLEVHRVTDTKVSRQEMYLIANTAMGGWWAGSPDETTPFPGEYKLDYIRVYQRNTPYDDVLLNDGISNLPLSDDIPGINSRGHRPPFELWPEGYPDGL